jgi:cyclase
MIKKRVIPIVLFKNGFVVQARKFQNHKNLGLLRPTLARLEEWGADEIIIVNISPTENVNKSQQGRTDIAHEFDFDFFQAVSKHASLSSVPLTVGGGIRTFSEGARYFEIGADKLLINTGFHMNNDLVLDLGRVFGSQAIVLGVDYAINNGQREVFIDSGSSSTGEKISSVARRATEIGVGELLLNSIDRDGVKQGLDLEVVQELIGLPTPVILCGGVGEATHIADGLSVNGVHGVAAANYFHHVENAVDLARQTALHGGISVRQHYVQKV